jgi:hypothetical protein
MKAFSDQDQDLWTSEREVVELSLPGSVDFVVIARFTAATVGARAGFNLDDIDDLRLAVDELSISFGPIDADSCLRYEFVRDGDAVTVRFTREPTPGRAAEGSERAERADLSGGAQRDAGLSQQELAHWMQARELSAVLLDELVTSHGREITDGRSVAWLMKRSGKTS